MENRSIEVLAFLNNLGNAQVIFDNGYSLKFQYNGIKYELCNQNCRWVGTKIVNQTAIRVSTKEGGVLGLKKLLKGDMPQTSETKILKNITEFGQKLIMLAFAFGFILLVLEFFSGGTLALALFEGAMSNNPIEKGISIFVGIFHLTSFIILFVTTIIIDKDKDDF